MQPNDYRSQSKRLPDLFLQQSTLLRTLNLVNLEIDRIHKLNKK